MGTILKAICDCGYSKQTSLGGSKLDRSCNIPHQCKSCEQVVTIDEADEPICPNCGSSDVTSYAARTKCARSRHEKLTDDELKTLGLHKQSEEAASEFLVTSILKNGNYCPKCHNETLHFFATGSFS